MINATTTSQKRELIPAGNYIARCYQMIEIGTVNEIIQGVSKTLKKVRIGWEFPTELRVFNEEKGEQTIVKSKEYTLSLHEKSSLRADLKSWRGKDFTEQEAQMFDITKLISVGCMINIVHSPSKTDATKIYDNIAGITAIPKGFKLPDQINPTFILSYDDFDFDKFDMLPEFIKDKMKGSLEFAALQIGKQPQPAQIDKVYPDDLPF